MSLCGNMSHDTKSCASKRVCSPESDDRAEGNCSATTGAKSKHWLTKPAAPSAIRFAWANTSPISTVSNLTFGLPRSRDTWPKPTLALIRKALHRPEICQTEEAGRRYAGDLVSRCYKGWVKDGPPGDAPLLRHTKAQLGRSIGAPDEGVRIPSVATRLLLWRGCATLTR